MKKSLSVAAAVMIGLEETLRDSLSSRVVFLSDASVVNRMEELQAQLEDYTLQMATIQERADNEKRDLTKDEAEEIEKIFASFENTEAEIERRTRIADAAARTSAGTGRRTDPEEGAGRKVEPQPRNPRDVLTNGFHSFGEFALAVRGAVRAGPGMVDPRLTKNAAPTAGNEGTGADGGFAVPPEFRTEIMKKVMGEESLLTRTDQITASGNSITIPKDETTPWQTSGGLLAAWANENSQLTQSKPSLEQINIRLNKLTSLVPVTDELITDAPALSSYISRKVPEKFTSKINTAIISGTGAGQPRGLLNEAAKVSVAEESGQAAATIVFQNIVNMWSRLYAPCRPRSVWLINQDIEPQLLAMAFPNGGSGTAVPVYMPAGGLSASPYATLMGRPVIPVEACNTLGTEGDLILTDLTQYLSVVQTQGIRQDVSIHLWFDYDATAFRFIMRVAGQSWWTSYITPQNGSNTRSCIVTLATRAG